MTLKINVKVCYFLPLFTLLSQIGCSTQPDNDRSLPAHKLQKMPAVTGEAEHLPISPSSRIVDLSHFRAPETLAGLTLDGEISSQHGRTLQYRSQDAKEKLSLTLTGLPAGWDDMPAERAVASYYSEVRQRRVSQALQDSANALTIVNETLMDLEGQPSAQAQLRWVERGRPIQNQSLLITLIDRNVFIRISNASYRQTPRWLLQHGKRALAEFRAAQTP